MRASSCGEPGQRQTPLFRVRCPTGKPGLGHRPGQPHWPTVSQAHQPGHSTSGRAPWWQWPDSKGKRMLPKVAGSGSQWPRLEQTTTSSCNPLLLGPWHPKLSTQPFPALWFPVWYCCLPLLVPSTAHLLGRGSGGQPLDWRGGQGHRGQEGGRTASAPQRHACPSDTPPQSPSVPI